MKEQDLIGSDELAKLRQAERDHPETEHTNAGGWCKHCGCGNTLLGYRHLRSCAFSGEAPSPRTEQT